MSRKYRVELSYLREMYGKEKTIRKELRIKESALKCAEKLCADNNRNFNNLIETLIFDACRTYTPPGTIHPEKWNFKEHGVK